ncbi:alpha/beta hydrolase [Streptomyces sp. NPDC004610]|uniref:alpha/beta fold hydrolase n=1 Tax=unclassified Streptomyces TaxID=2593676 RepID=UPI0033A36BD4
MQWTERTVVRDGVRLVCRDWGGEGPPIVLLHGLAGHAGEWDALAGRLTGAWRVLAPDQRGHGGSERRPGEVSRAAYVADVVALVEGLGLAVPVVLAGQSLGGHTAVLTAARHPELVRALVVVEAGAGAPDPQGPERIGRWLDSWPVPFPSYGDAVRFFGGGAVSAGWADGLQARDGGLWPRFDREVLVGALAETAERSFAADWDRISCPTLLVLAESGFLAPAEVDDLLRRRMPELAVSVTGTGHDLHLQRPGLLAALIARFLPAPG